MSNYTNIADIERHCKLPGWDGELAEAVTQETIDFCSNLIDLTKGIDYQVEALTSGCVEITFFITNKAELKVIGNEKTHIVGFFNGNLDFDKTVNNSKVLQTAEAVQGFQKFYRLVYA